MQLHRNTKNPQARSARPLVRGSRGGKGFGDGRPDVLSNQQQVDIPVARPLAHRGGRGSGNGRSDVPSNQEQVDIPVLGASGPLDGDQSQHHSGHQRSNSPQASLEISLSSVDPPRVHRSQHRIDQRTRSPAGRRSQVIPSGTYGEFLGLVHNPGLRKRKSASSFTQGERESMTAEEVEEVERQEENELQKLREFDQQVRLTTSTAIDLKETDPAWQIHKVKLFDNIGPNPKESNAGCASLRVEVLNATTFHHIWYYLEGRIDEDLGRYSTSSGSSWARLINVSACFLLHIYDAAPLAAEFAEVDWDDFRIIDKEVRKKKSKVSVKDVLAQSFKAVAPLPKNTYFCLPQSSISYPHYWLAHLAFYAGQLFAVVAARVAPVSHYVRITQYGLQDTNANHKPDLD
ncbi:hypothetical protein V8E54_006698 [Elaphomyces granulatus]